jgi:hypothetical protein
MREVKNAAQIPPRLLSLSLAAAYCGVSTEMFLRACPVRSIALGPSARLRRWDLQALDRWIDGFNDNERKEPQPADAWLAKMDDQS